MKRNEIKQLSDIEHVLLRPGQYIGSIVLTKCETFTLDKENEKFNYKQIEYNPGFLKIIYEILDNAVDESIRTNFKYATNISVDIDEKIGKITVKDDGRGIPLGDAKGTDKPISQLELALTELRAGSNFVDEERNLLGMNGVGASLTNVFSKSFEAVVFDKVKKGVLTCSNNLSEKSCIVKNHKSKTSGTTISFIPDYKKFGMKNIDQIHIDLIHQRLMFLSLTYPEITFKLNKSIIRFKNNKNFMKCFNDDFVVMQDNNTPCKYLIGVIPNHYDDFTHKSYINGADCINGGNHIDYIHNELISRIKDKLNKKYSSIKTGDIKNKLTYIINFREFINPTFNSQTKENFSSNISEIKNFLKDVDWDDFANKIVKNNAIMDPILETFKIKEELKNRQLLKKIGKTVKDFKCEKFLPATENKKFFAICEGDCLEKNTLIWNIGENKNVKLNDINIGDLVLTHNQNIKAVVNKTSKMINCFKLKTKSGKEIICSKEHRFYVYDTITKTFKFKKLKNLNKDTDKLIKNKLLNGMIFDKIKIEKNNDKKYQLKIQGDTFECVSSYKHKFLVFNTELNSIELLKAKDINQDIHLMILLENVSF